MTAFIRSTFGVIVFLILAEVPFALLGVLIYLLGGFR